MLKFWEKLKTVVQAISRFRDAKYLFYLISGSMLMFGINIIKHLDFEPGKSIAKWKTK